MHDRKAREAKLNRQMGMSPEQREQLNAVNAKLDDWYTPCKRCGTVRYGTIAELTKPCQCNAKG